MIAILAGGRDNGKQNKRANHELLMCVAVVGVAPAGCL